MARCYIWTIALYGSEIWILKKPKRKYFVSFEMTTKIFK
jgi:hypothetical protein